ncbi:ThuA domain-containing protein [Hydrocarboniphaga sp.]|uniref:ThuA domain-containing protein n=1 Tax=Hydrocarboniphaga sp. TaxID=2033016 RepID=UPI003D124F95
MTEVPSPAENSTARPRRIGCVLVAGGKYHDIDFARLELLKLLAEDSRVQVRVFEDYEHIAAIEAADILISYTCDIVPSLPAQEAIRAWVERGGRWYALHGSNSILRWTRDGRVESPRWAPLHMNTLGTQFIAHPPIAPYRVTVANRAHPLVEGVEPFETTDEIYLMDVHAELDVLLHTRYGGSTPEFVDSQWADADHPVFYIRHLGAGQVLYLTLGHCRGHYDLRPLMDWWPTVDRCAWDLPVFYTLLRRGIAWIKQPFDEVAEAGSS